MMRSSTRTRERAAKAFLTTGRSCRDLDGPSGSSRGLSNQKPSRPKRNQVQPVRYRTNLPPSQSVGVVPLPLRDQMTRAVAGRAMESRARSMGRPGVAEPRPASLGGRPGWLDGVRTRDRWSVHSVFRVLQPGAPRGSLAQYRPRQCFVGRRNAGVVCDWIQLASRAWSRGDWDGHQEN